MAYTKPAHQVLINHYHSSFVVEDPTKVWHTEDNHKFFVSEEPITLFRDLIAADDNLKLQSFEELSYDVRAKSERSVAMACIPSKSFAWTRPEKIINEPTFRKLRPESIARNRVRSGNEAGGVTLIGLDILRS